MALWTAWCANGAPFGAFAAARSIPCSVRPEVGVSRRPWCPQACSRGGARGEGPAPEAGILDGGWLVGLVERADVGAGRHDLVDPVEHVVGEGHVQAGEQVVEL